jgi:thioredoxin-like negative regulator of GroEL
MRTRILLYILPLIMGVGFAGFYIAPGGREIALMRLEDNNFTKALDYYKMRQAQGDNSINVLAPLVKIHIHYGEIDKAIELMQAYVDENPRSVEGLKQLSVLYKSAQKFNKYCEVLEVLQKISPSINYLREMADTYRFLGMHKEEMNSLAKLLDSNRYRPEEDDYMELASLYLVNKQHKEATQTMLDFFSHRNYDVSISTIHLTVQLLAEIGEDRKALYIANAYLRGLKKEEREENAIVISSVFQRKGRIESAFAILTQFLPNLDNSPQLLMRVVELKQASGKDKEVYTDLSKRFARNILPSLLEVTLIDLAIENKNYKLVEAVLRKADMEQITDISLISYADMASDLKWPELATLIRSRLTKTYLNEAPLLKAILDVAEYNTPASMEALSHLDKDLISQPWQKMVLVRIYVRHAYSRQAFAMLDEVTIEDMYATLDATQVAEIYLATDASIKGVKRLNNEIKSAVPVLQDKIDNTLFLLSAGRGEDAAVENWLKKHKDVKPALLSDAYSIANRYKHNNLALVFAESIYKIDPKKENILYLAEALMLNNRYARAMGLLQPYAEQDPEARVAYINGMADWVRQIGVNANDANRLTFDVFLSAVLKRTDLTINEKRNLAYLLSETGLRSKAESIFIELAGDKPFADHDVSELLAFWGDHLPETGAKWVKDRAENATGTEQALWLSYANDAGRPEVVISILDNKWQKASASALTEYINALITTKNNNQLGVVLNQQIDDNVLPDRLSKFSTIAMQEGHPNIAEKGWNKLYQIDPNNNEAIKELGIIALNVNHFTEAGTLLEKYLKNMNNEADYRVNYAYAEVLQHKGEIKQAKNYFEKAFQQISSIPEKGMEEKIAEAYLLYRVNRLNESFDLYRQLLGQYPQNKMLRADFSQVLIDNKKFNEASQLLSQ